VDRLGPRAAASTGAGRGPAESDPAPEVVSSAPATAAPVETDVFEAEPIIFEAQSIELPEVSFLSRQPQDPPPASPLPAGPPVGLSVAAGRRRVAGRDR